LNKSVNEFETSELCYGKSKYTHLWEFPITCRDIRCTMITVLFCRELREIPITCRELREFPITCIELRFTMITAFSVGN